MKQFVTYLTILICLDSCRPKEQRQIDDRLEPEWDWFKIRNGLKHIWVPLKNDTCFMLNFDGNSYLKNDGSSDEKKTIFFLSKSEKDSLMFYAKRAIYSYSEANQYVENKTGEYVYLSLDKKNGSISCSYQSVLDWTAISPAMTKINALTFLKVK